MRIGIDLGGTKIEGILLDAAGDEIARHRMPTPGGNYDATLAAIGEIIGVLAKNTEIDVSVPVGVGIPGAQSQATGLIKNANSTCLIGKPFDADLRKSLGRPVRLANDADCFTISEAKDGAGAGFGVVFGVILGTGVGGGIAVDGDLMAGPNAIAGEWGHNPLPWPDVVDDQDERPGPQCYCGHRGCIETYLSGPGLARDHELHTGQSVDAAEIARSAEHGQPESDASLSRYEHRLARALATVINILDPGVIVLGGGLSNISRLYENVPKLWSDLVFSDRVDTHLKPNKHGASSGVRGAAWLWP